MHSCQKLKKQLMTKENMRVLEGMAYGPKHMI